MKRMSSFQTAALLMLVSCSDTTPRSTMQPNPELSMRQDMPKAAANDMDTVTVPPGHRVVVVRAAPSPSLFKSESEYWIAQTGTNGGTQSILNELQTLADKGESCSVIWIIPAQFLDSIADPDEFVAKVSKLIEDSKSRIGLNAVLPGASSEHAAIMSRLHSAGVGIHFAANDGACFVEVHKPDGISVGMPGAAYSK